MLIPDINSISAKSQFKVIGHTIYLSVDSSRLVVC